MKRNVILLVLDSVRKDYFDQFAPRIQNRADVEFADCRAATSWSSPSHASMLTGKLPHEHGVHTYNFDFGVIPFEETFLAALPEHRCICVTSNEYASHKFGFDEFFDEYTYINRHRRFPSGFDPSEVRGSIDSTGVSFFYQLLRQTIKHDYPAQSLANLICASINASNFLQKSSLPLPFDDGAKPIANEIVSQVSRANEPTFVFANIMDIHGPLRHIRGFDSSLHSVPNGWDSNRFDNWDVNFSGELEENWEHIENYRELYGAAIDYVDRVVDDLISTLHEETTRETTIVVTADHGDNLAYESDDYMFDHKSTLSEGVLHVPCYVLNAPEKAETDVNTEYFSQLRLGELVEAMSDGNYPTVTENRIVAELLGPGANLGPLVNDGNEQELSYWHRSMRCAYDGDGKYLWDSTGDASRCELHKEPNRVQSVESGGDIPEWAEDKFDDDIVTIDDRITPDSLDTSVSVNRATKNRLEELGYL